MKERYIKSQVIQDLNNKMVFIAGPRQAGKTTLSKSLKDQKVYLNWDIDSNRSAILKNEFPESGLLILDEIHKYRRWRNLLKGLYDSVKFYDKPLKILVTGSAKLDVYRFGGDSLQGRYHFLRLYPFSIAELSLKKNEVNKLLELSAFPEPYLSNSIKEATRWSREYKSRVIREDLRDLERLNDLGTFQLLIERLPELVGSPLSINALREDLQISHKSAKSWLDIAERLYFIFRLNPLASSKIRAVKKEQKHYHFDWVPIADEGAKFENFVAFHLIKWVHFNQDTEGKDIELNYFRDTDGREVDFVVTEKRKPILLVEVKLKEQDISKSLYYAKQKFPECKAYQLYLYGTKDYEKDGIRVCHAWELLKALV